MKYLFFILLFPLAVQAQIVTNQRLFDTIPFIPEHTPQRLAQFAKEPIVTGKIIFLGNSITEMGNWKKGPWQEIWDGLFWRFMHVHRDLFLQNPRLGMLIKTFDKMPDDKRSKHLTIAEKFLGEL